MKVRRLGAVLLTGIAIAVGCGSDEDDGGGTPGDDAGTDTGSGGTSAAGGVGGDAASGGTAGGATGGTSTGGTSGTAGAAGAAGAPPLCTSDADCPAPQQCVNGGCVECETNDQCTAPDKCINGVCLECQTNTDCTTGMVCIGGACQEGCTTNADCAAGEECIAGGCLSGPCEKDADCVAPELCVGGRCGTVVPATCQGMLYQCGNGLDDDGDGLTDMNDPDCLGPCSNNEGNFHNCIPGGGSNACVVDCYFDKDSGSGNDTCEWDHRCDPLEKAEGAECPYTCKTTPGCNLVSQSEDECITACNKSVPATSKTCSQLYQAQTTTCESFCGELTPNGCDCFGCCDVQGNGDYRFMGSTSNDRKGDCDSATCTLAKAIEKDIDGKPTAESLAACKPCVPVKSCLNTCVPEECECCIAGCDLPCHCNNSCGTGGVGGAGGAGGSGGTPTGGAGGSGGGGGTGGCPTPFCDGLQPCGLSCLAPCPPQFFCSTGCCRQIPT